MDLKDTVAGTLSGAVSNASPADVSSVVGNLLPSSSTSLEEALKSVTKGLEGLTSVNLTQSEVVNSNTQAIEQNTAAQSSSGLKGAASTIGKAASNILTSGLGMMPVVSAIRSLFSGGSVSEPAPLVKYSAPSPIRVEGTISSGWVPVSGASASTSASSGSTAGQSASGTASVGTAPAPQITIQVQAMDSRSFMDRSGDIAQAVREAMLNMHSLNDVISDA